MSLTFYYGSGSPFGWRVFLALEHMRVPYTLRVLAFSKRENQTPEFLKINPRGKIPAIDDDGFTLYESTAIVEYLQERFPDAPRLYPSGLRERATVRRFVQEIDCYFGRPIDDLAMQIYFKPAAEWDAKVLDHGRSETLVELARLESLVQGPFLAGAMSAADFALYPFIATLRRFELRKPDLGLAAAVGPKLLAIATSIEALPYFDKTVPPHWKA